MPDALRRALIVSFLAGVCWVGTPTARAADAFQFHLLVTGVAIGEAWDCPFAGGPPPAVDTSAASASPLYSKKRLRTRTPGELRGC